MDNIKQTKTPPTQLPSRYTLNLVKSNSGFLGFTLVELIVVIVILAILATIAFLSFNSYSSSSRDSVRLSDINSLNKSLELFNISAAKYPDPTNVYTRVVYSGGVIFEQGSVGDSVITAVQKVSKKPIDPLDSGEYTYSTNLNRTSFQLKGTLENKLSTGFKENGNSIIARNEAIQASSFGAKGNGVEGIYENNSSSLLSNVFNGLKDISTTLRSVQYDDIIGMTTEINADTNSGSRICYVKGNFNGLIEKTNTGNTNYILAVPGLIVGETNYNLDYNSLSGKVICNGLSNPCIIEYTPTLVFVGTGNSVPTTSTQITDIMTSLQSAYSGSNVSSSNTTISNLLSSSGSSLVSLGSSLVSKVGVTSSNIVVTNASCTATSYSGYNILAQNDPEIRTYTRTGSTAGGTRTYTIQANCNNGTLSYGVETTSVSCNSGFVQSAGYTCIAATCNGSIADANGHSTATSQSNLQSWAYNSTPGICSWDCNTNYSWNGSSCEENCASGFIKIPGNTDFSQGNFCVAKYEMKAAGGSIGPSANGVLYHTHDYNVANTIVSNATDNVITLLTQAQAIAACQSMGVGYHLITENERMTVARNVELQSSNWSSGIVGNGYMYSGHNDNSPAYVGVSSSDDNNGYINTGDSATSPGDSAYYNFSSNAAQAYKGQKRTLVLSNGEVIWDLAGNVWEHINKANTLDGSYYNDGSNWVSSACGTINWFAFNNGDTVGAAPGGTCIFQNGYSYSNIGPKTLGLNSNNGIGRIYSSNFANNIFFRGGDWTRGPYAGIYAIHLGWNETTSFATVGFRCAK